MFGCELKTLANPSVTHICTVVRSRSLLSFQLNWQLKLNVLNVQVHYYNGDLKEVSERGVTKYLYQDSQTWHTTHPDGREVTVFSNGQTEVSFLQPVWVKIQFYLKCVFLVLLNFFLDCLYS